MKIRQFLEKIRWMNHDAELVWVAPDEVESKLEFVIAPADTVDKVILRGAPTEEQKKAVAEKVRAAIRGSYLGSQDEV